MTLLPDKDNLAKQLQELTHLNTRELAEAVGVGYTTYYLWLTGKQPSKAHTARLQELIEYYQFMTRKQALAEMAHIAQDADLYD